MCRPNVYGAWMSEFIGHLEDFTTRVPRHAARRAWLQVANALLPLKWDRGVKKGQPTAPRARRRIEHRVREAVRGLGHYQVGKSARGLHDFPVRQTRSLRAWTRF
jgi:hypothetical protein